MNWTSPVHFYMPVIPEFIALFLFDSLKTRDLCKEFLTISKLQFCFLCHDLRSLTYNCSIFSVTNSCNSLIIMVCPPAELYVLLPRKQNPVSPFSPSFFIHCSSFLKFNILFIWTFYFMILHFTNMNFLLRMNRTTRAITRTLNNQVIIYFCKKENKQIFFF